MKFDFSLSLCLVTASQVLGILFSIWAPFYQALAYSQSHIDDVETSDAVTVTLVPRSVSSLLKTTPPLKTIMRNRCDPQIERKLREKLQRKDKKLKMLRQRLAMKGKESKLRTKNSKEQAHESPYCLQNNLMKNRKKITTNKTLAAVRNNVKHLKRKVIFLQRRCMDRVHESTGLTHTRKEKVLSEMMHVRKLIFPGWNVSMSALLATSDSQILSEIMNAFQDGLYVIGSTVAQMSKNKELEQEVSEGLKHLERFKTDSRFGIYPLLRDLELLAASLNATLTQSHLCAGTALRDKVASLVAGSEESLCGMKENQIGLYCRSSGFLTFVRRFLVLFSRTVDRLSSSGDSALV